MKTQELLKIIHFIGGEKGGLGKSFFSRIFAQFWLDKNSKIAFFDADRSNTTFYRYCHSDQNPVDKLFFSEAEEYLENGNILIETAFTKDVLIDLPGQSIHALNEWLELNYIFNVAKSLNLKLIYWFVSDGSADSIGDFQIVTKLFQSKMQYVFVKNLGKCSSWDSNIKQIEGLFKTYDVEIVSLPAFNGDKLKEEIEKKSMTWGEAREYPGFSNSLFDRHRVKAYLNSAYEAIGSATIVSQRIAVSSPDAKANQLIAVRPNASKKDNNANK